eukprot:772229-Rhodomonas_salina.2
MLMGFGEVSERIGVRLACAADTFSKCSVRDCAGVDAGDHKGGGAAVRLLQRQLVPGLNRRLRYRDPRPRGGVHVREQGMPRPHLLSLALEA